MSLVTNQQHNGGNKRHDIISSLHNGSKIGTHVPVSINKCGRIRTFSNAQEIASNNRFETV